MNKILSSKEKRAKRIKQLEAKLQKERSLLNKQNRKQRNGELISFGIAVETSYKKYDSYDDKKKLKEFILKNLDARNLERAKSGFDRLDKK